MYVVELGQQRMRVGMIAHGMPFRHHAPHDVGVGAGHRLAVLQAAKVASDHIKNRVYPVRLKDVEHARRVGGVRPVVKGEQHAAFGQLGAVPLEKTRARSGFAVIGVIGKGTKNFIIKPCNHALRRNIVLHTAHVGIPQRTRQLCRNRTRLQHAVIDIRTEAPAYVADGGKASLHIVAIRTLQQYGLQQGTQGCAQHQSIALGMYRKFSRTDKIAIT